MYRKRSTKKNILIYLAIGLAGILIFSALELTNTTNLIHKESPAQPAKTTKNSGPTPEQKQQQDAAYSKEKQQLIENNQKTTKPTPAPTATETSITLTAKQETNGTVTIQTNLGNITDGNCQLVINNGPRTITKTAEVIYAPTFSTCAGFSVPVSDLGTGSWEVKLTVTGSSQPASKTITQEIK